MEENARGNKNKARTRRRTSRRRGNAGGKRTSTRKTSRHMNSYLEQTGVRTLHTRGLEKKQS
jgi:hypothetical protein